eukprot:m.68906 g.68906  ORF g.68906 m.68906 type:complete len:141 (-) comp8258_c14_seq2:237-659(-)
MRSKSTPLMLDSVDACDHGSCDSCSNGRKRKDKEGVRSISWKDSEGDSLSSSMNFHRNDPPVKCNISFQWENERFEIRCRSRSFGGKEGNLSPYYSFNSDDDNYDDEEDDEEDDDEEECPLALSRFKSSHARRWVSVNSP